ncbi:MAG: hypothetical protein RLZZ237_2976, partial [Pseudomonadota bacterium]
MQPISPSTILPVDFSAALLV